MKKSLLILLITALASCKVNKLAKEVVIKDYYIKNELLIQLYDLSQVEELEQKFNKQGFKVVDEVAPWLKIVKAEFDTTKIDPAKMVAKLKLSGMTNDVEFNKRLTQRDWFRMA